METVCVSFKELYLANGAYLKYGGYIDFYTDADTGEEYYDLRTADPDAAGSTLLACDGEEFKIIDRLPSGNYVLENTASGSRVYLTAEEYSIAVFK